MRPAGKDGTNYAELYEKAKVTFDGETIRYAGGGTIDTKLVHDDHAFYGLVISPQKGATSVTVYTNGVETEEVDLTKDGDFVVDGQLIEYFAFALAAGGKMPATTWVLDFVWHLPHGDRYTRMVVRRA